MDGERHDDDAMLRDVLADIRADVRDIARESRENNRLLQEELSLLHAQVIELRTRLGMVSGIAGLFGGAMVVAVTKGLGVLFAKS